MKTSHQQPLVAAALTLCLAASQGIASTVITPDDWFAHYSANRGDRMESGDTGSPTYYLATSGNPRSMGAVWSYFDPIALTDGASINLSTQITVRYTTNVERVFETFRFGLFHSDPSERATTTTFGTDRYVSDLPGSGLQNSNWTGFMFSVNETSSAVYRRNPGDYVFYTTSGESSTRVDLDDGIVIPTFAHGVPVTLSLSFSRSGDDLLVSGTLAGDAFSGRYTNAFLSYGTSFDTLGFWTSNTVPTTNLTSITFQDTTLSVIPEPSSLMLGLLLLGGWGVGQAWRKIVRDPLA